MTPPARGSILVGVDFSEASAGAISLAGALATALGAQLTAVHAEVLEAPPYFTHEQLDAMEQQRREARAEAAEYLERFVRERSNVSAKGILVDEPPVEALLRLSASADILVLGTHGRRGPSRWWLGSVAERVVRAATVPVLVAQGAVAPSSPSAVFRRLLVARAHDAPAANADALAHRIGTAFGGTIEVGGALDSCERSQVEAASLLVLAVPAPRADRTIGHLESDVIRTCGRPVLFVPASA